MLVIKEGPLAGRRFEIELELVVGREEAGLTIEDAEISRRHAAFRFGDGLLELEDLGSLNGTFVNGSRIDAVTPLGLGDVVRVGHTSIEVESIPDSRRTVLATPSPEPQQTVQRPPASPTPPAQPAPAAPPPAAAPPQPNLGAFAPAVPRRRRAAATRRLTPTLLSFGAIGATAVALVVYFAQH